MAQLAQLREALNTKCKSNNMKTSWCLLKLSLLFISLWACPRPAHAYYDPGIQRWISRDPIGEPGFRGPQGLAAPAPARLLSEYVVVANTPISVIDPHGLTPLADCFANCLQQSQNRMEGCKSVANTVGSLFASGGAVVGGVMGIEGGLAGITAGAFVVGGVNYVGWGGCAWIVCAYKAAILEAQCNFSCVGEHGW